MSSDPLELCQGIYDDFGEFCAQRGAVSEADTRVNILDRLIHDVLGWPRKSVTREGHNAQGYMDYKLTAGIPRVVVEAKREGTTFVLPYRKRARRAMKISGALSGDPNLKAAIKQAQRYCSEEGIRFAVVTNGYSFIIFRSMVEGHSWREGKALVFRGPKDIFANFNEFYNLLSYEAVGDAKLDEAFVEGESYERQHHRPVSSLVNADATYDRNPLVAALRPYVDQVFGDIARQDDVKVLETCYVNSTPVQIIDSNLKLIIQDNLPAFVEGGTQLTPTTGSPAGQLDDDIREVLKTDNMPRTVVVLMGGIGSGKSTFLRRFFRIVSPDLVTNDGPSALVYLDLLGAPDQEDLLNGHIWDTLADELRQTQPFLDTRPFLEEMFAQELKLVDEIYSDQPDQLTTLRNDMLYKRASDTHLFSERALRQCRYGGKLPIVVFDNVDQLGTPSQVAVFTTAQHLAQTHRALSILVLREESYAAARMQKHLTAYTIRPYHLSSPDFRDMIIPRIDYAMAKIAAEHTNAPSTEKAHRLQQVSDFLRVLRESVLGRNKNVVSLIRAISFGNARLALDLLNAFMTSGAANMPKILRIRRDTGGYTIPFHEFAKSVILGEYRYYQEARSLVLNVFHVTNAQNASHFTALRILRYLSKYQSINAPSQGFVSLNVFVNELSDPFNNEDDCIKQLARLISLNRQLVELDTRRTDSLTGASSIRITSAGAYYLYHFVQSFSYLDLVWHDTALDDQRLAEELSRDINETHMPKRFLRVEKFLRYLKTQEEADLQMGTVPQDHPDFYGPFVSGMYRAYQKEKKTICQKLKLPYSQCEGAS